MLDERRDAAMRLALALGRLQPMERRATRFVWMVDGRVRRMVVASGGRRCACSRAGGLAYTKARPLGSECEHLLKLQSDPV
ncbi:MAG: hypothetical protein ABL955_11135 [Elusimicrobiota bacterium]